MRPQSQPDHLASEVATAALVAQQRPKTSGIMRLEGQPRSRPWRIATDALVALAALGAAIFGWQLWLNNRDVPAPRAGCLPGEPRECHPVAHPKRRGDSVRRERSALVNGARGTPIVARPATRAPVVGVPGAKCSAACRFAVGATPGRHIPCDPYQNGTTSVASTTTSFFSMASRATQGRRPVTPCGASSIQVSAVNGRTR